MEGEYDGLSDKIPISRMVPFKKYFVLAITAMFKYFYLKWIATHVCCVPERVIGFLFVMKNS